jgi:hypothetical protein
VTQAFHRAVVQVDMGQLDQVLRQRIHVNAEAVVLGGDGALACLQVPYWLVPAPVAELEFICVRAEG